MFSCFPGFGVLSIWSTALDSARVLALAYCCSHHGLRGGASLRLSAIRSARMTAPRRLAQIHPTSSRRLRALEVRIAMGVRGAVRRQVCAASASRVRAGLADQELPRSLGCSVHRRSPDAVTQPNRELATARHAPIECAPHPCARALSSPPPLRPLLLSRPPTVTSALEAGTTTAQDRRETTKRERR
jgi:hypothetical protein